MVARISFSIDENGTFACVGISYASFNAGLPHVKMPTVLLSEDQYTWANSRNTSPRILYNVCWPELVIKRTSKPQPLAGNGCMNSTDADLSCLSKLSLRSQPQLANKMTNRTIATDH